MRLSGDRDGRSAAAPVSGISTVSRDIKAQEYRAKGLLACVIDAIVVHAVIGLAVAEAVLPAFLTGILIPGYSKSIPFGAYFSTSMGFSLSSTSPSQKRPTARPWGREYVASRHHGNRREADAGHLFPQEREQDQLCATPSRRDLGLALEVGYTKKFSDRFLGTASFRDSERPDLFWTEERTF